MRAVLISIPHTGTQFTAKVFRDAGFETRGLFEVGQRDTLHVAHMVKPGQIAQAKKLAGEFPLILPLRHPFVVEEAWKRRGRPIGELIECFGTFSEVFWPLGAYMMPVDSPRREECLAEMADGLGLPLKTDWSVQNGREGTHRLTWRDCEPSPAVENLADEIAPILERFY